MKDLTQQDDIIIANVYVSNSRTPKYMNQKLTKLQVQILYKNNWKFQFAILNNRLDKQAENEETEELNQTIIQ